MATITGYTKAFMDTVRGLAIASGVVSGGHLILTRIDTTTLDVGSVVGPAGPTGPASVNAVVLATTANDTLSGLTARDGVTPIAGDLVLVKNQTTVANNGIYVAASGAWTRWTSADTSGEVAGLGAIQVKAGTVNGGKRFMTTFKSTDTLGTTAMIWSQLDVDDTGWVNLTLSNAWVNYDSGLQTGGTGRPAQARLKGGVVYFKGNIRTGTNGTSIMTLPTQFRGAVNSPGNERVYPVQMSGGIGYIVMDFATGTMVPWWASPAAGNSVTELSGIGPYTVD